MEVGNDMKWDAGNLDFTSGSSKQNEGAGYLNVKRNCNNAENGIHYAYVCLGA